MKTDCDIIRDLLPLYSDKVCSESSRRLVEEHCAKCEECAEQLTAMSAELPREEKAGGAKNPLKKTRRHYLKLAFLTAAVAVPMAVVICILCAISINETNHSGQISWSAIAAEREMTDFGNLLKKGNYRKALSMVGFKGLDDVNRKNEGERLDAYTKIFGDFFSQYPISDIDCEAHYYCTIMRGELDLYLDQKYTYDIPLKVYICFEMDEEGDCYITKAIVNSDDTGDKYQSSEDEWMEIDDKFSVPAYPGNLALERIEGALKGNGFIGSDNTLQIFTSEFNKRNNEVYRIYDKYIAEGDWENTETEECKAELAPMVEARDEYLANYSAEVKRLFTDAYTLISVEGEEPYYSDEVYLDNSVYAYGKGCFKQRFTLNMETKEGESFFVKFTSKVQYFADIPEDIEFSDNAPEGFREGFSKLFC
ncbi:MAG: zf-HC2 domain-containing protein [Oscillospiraceae bacterium]|nr:zf-HC2 domain-containing protein [Oscillospiraceae bacterium]